MPERRMSNPAAPLSQLFRNTDHLCFSLRTKCKTMTQCRTTNKTCSEMENAVLKVLSVRFVVPLVFLSCGRFLR